MTHQRKIMIPIPNIRTEGNNLQLEVYVDNVHSFRLKRKYHRDGPWQVFRIISCRAYGPIDTQVFRQDALHRIKINFYSESYIQRVLREKESAKKISKHVRRT
jgi:hypothetical protein